MIKKLILIILLFGFFYTPKNVNAQCSGTVACGNNVVRQCRDSSGSNCIEGTPGCNCSAQCIGGGSHSCNAYPFCQASSICGVYEGVCVRSGSCNYTPPPPPDEEDPGGGQGGGNWESCGSCSSCGQGSECRFDPGGLCVWDPGGCGGGGTGSPFDCTINSISRDTSVGAGPLYPGSLFRVRADVDVEPEECERTSATCLKQLTARSLDSSVMLYNSVRDTSGINDQEDKNFPAINPPGVAQSVGSFTVRVEGEGRRCPTCNVGSCTMERTFNVVAPPPNAPVVTITNPLDGGTIPLGQTFPIEATATDSDGTVTKVDFYVNGNLAGTDNTPPSPFSVISSRTINNPATRPITARATDNDGNVGVATIFVTAVANAGPTVTIDSPPNGKQVIVGAPEPVLATATDNDGDTVSQVEFQVSVNGGAYTALSTDTAGPPWSSELICTEPTPHTIRARGTDSNGNQGPWSPPVTVSGLDPNPWFQVGGGSIFSRGNITSPIPPTLTEYFLADDAISGKPGLAIYSGNVSVGSGTLSRTEWQTNTSTTANPFNYAHFNNLASGKIPPQNEFSSGLPANLQSSGIVPTDGYYYIRHSGNLTLNSPLTVNNARMVIFVNGDLTINQRVTINNRRNSFLMFVVSGNINVSPSLSSSGLSDPALEGMFFANGTFSSGSNNTDDERLVVRGSVAASNINLDRDLQAENSTTAAEAFIFSPELVVNYPPAMSIKHLVWREVAP